MELFAILRSILVGTTVLSIKIELSPNELRVPPVLVGLYNGPIVWNSELRCWIKVARLACLLETDRVYYYMYIYFI